MAHSGEQERAAALVTPVEQNGETRITENGETRITVGLVGGSATGSGLDSQTQNTQQNAETRIRARTLQFPIPLVPPRRLSSPSRLW